jgi:hypothetical protein
MDRKSAAKPDLELMELLESDDSETDVGQSESGENQAATTNEVPVEIKLLSFDEGSKGKGSGGTFSRGCLTIGCGFGVMLLVGVFMAGYSSLKESVWVGFDASCERVASGLPFEMTAARREKLKVDMKDLGALLQTMDDPYETMGRFTSVVNLSFRDGLLNMREIEKIEGILDEILRSSGEATE